VVTSSSQHILGNTPLNHSDSRSMERAVSSRMEPWQCKYK